jgi:hypothetical protein
MNRSTPRLTALLKTLPALVRTGSLTSTIHDTLWPEQNGDPFRQMYALFVWDTYPPTYNREAIENFLLLVAGMPPDVFEDFISAWAGPLFVATRPPSAFDRSHTITPDTPPTPAPVFTAGPTSHRVYTPAETRAGSFHGVRSL